MKTVRTKPNQIGFPLVLIEWVDSSRIGDGWRMLDEIEAPEPHLCVSVGFVVKESKDAKVLAPNLADVRSDDNRQAYGGIMIPTGAIVREEVLKR